MHKSPHSNTTRNHIPSRAELLVAGQLSIVGLILTLIGTVSLTWLVPLFPVMMIFGVAIVIFIQAARVRRVNSHVIIVSIALGLTCVSFASQPAGPEIGGYGTECVPIEDCFRPLRGAGFPLQYMTDIPGITAQDRLGVEDEFRPWAFFVDVMFYLAIGEAIHQVYRYFKVKTGQ